MVKVICQYTGIEFEAKSARTKNHPEVAQWLAEANQKGCYSELITALRQWKESGTRQIGVYRYVARRVLNYQRAKKAKRGHE
jgi:hypothetical protein